MQEQGAAPACRGCSTLAGGAPGAWGGRAFGHATTTCNRGHPNHSAIHSPAPTALLYSSTKHRVEALFLGSWNARWMRAMGWDSLLGQLGREELHLLEHSATSLR